MSVPWPTVENIEDFLQHVEEVVVTTVSSATADMPSVREAIQRLWEDIDRFGPWQSLPPLPEIKIPNLGSFEVPPPPPPPPVPRGIITRSADWVGAHPWKTAFIGIGLVGAGVAVGYGGLYLRHYTRVRKVRTASGTHAGAERRQVVGEHDLGMTIPLNSG